MPRICIKELDIEETLERPRWMLRKGDTFLITLLTAKESDHHLRAGSKIEINPWWWYPGAIPGLSGSYWLGSREAAVISIASECLAGSSRTWGHQQGITDTTHYRLKMGHSKAP